MTDQIIMFISQLFNGLKIGSVYALVALGYTMVYGIIRLINFAHGDFIMVGAYVLMLTIPAIVAMGLPAWVAVIPAILVCVAVGVIVEKAAYKPVREKGNSMTALITAIAMSFELAAYGAASGLLYRVLPKKIGSIYAALVLSMIAGRLVWGVARYLLAGLAHSTFTPSLFLAGAVTSALPGIALHILLIPALVTAMEKAKLILN